MTPLFLRDVGIRRPGLWESFKRLWFRVSSSLFLGCRLIDIWMCLFLILGENGELCNVLSKMSGIPEENLEYTKVWLFNALLAHFLTFFYFPPQTDYKLISSLQCFSHEHSHINLVLTTRHLQWSINAEWRNLGVLHVISCPSNLFFPITNIQRFTFQGQNRTTERTDKRRTRANAQQKCVRAKHVISYINDLLAEKGACFKNSLGLVTEETRWLKL